MSVQAPVEIAPVVFDAGPAEKRRGTVWAGAAVVGGLTLLVFLPALRNGFVNFDDIQNFLANPNYRGLRWGNVRWMFTSQHMGHYIPIAWLTLGLDYVLWGMKPVGYHLTSIVFHAVNAVLVYVLALRLIRLALTPSAVSFQVGAGEALKPLEFPLGAAVAALLFSVHPLRVESVVWITERRDLVCGLFSLLTVLAYVRACPTGRSGRLHASWYWTAVVFFALALLSKSTVVGLPIALLAIDYYPLRRIPFRGLESVRRVARLLVEKVPFFLLSAAVSIVMLFIGRRPEGLTSLATLGIVERFAISGYALVFYLWKTFAPWPLSPLYELHYPVRPLAAEYILPCAVILVISAGVILARHRWPAALTAWLGYVVLLLPVIGITHNGMQIAADRYTYLACLGWPLLAGGALMWCRRGSRTGVIPHRLARLVVALSVTVIVSLGALSTLEIRAWRDSEALWRHALALDPESAFAHYNLGGALWTLGQIREAQRELELAVDLLPDRLANSKAMFHASFGLLLQQQGDLADAELHYRAALSFSADNLLALNNLGVIYALRGDRQAALDSFLHVLRVVPGHQDACANGRRLATSLGVEPKELERCPPLAERERRSG